MLTHISFFQQKINRQTLIVNSSKKKKSLQVGPFFIIQMTTMVNKNIIWNNYSFENHMQFFISAREYGKPY